MSIFMFLMFFSGRLRAAFDELTEMLKNEKDLEEKDEYVKAKEVLKEAESQLA